MLLLKGRDVAADEVDQLAVGGAPLIGGGVGEPGEQRALDAQRKMCDGHLWNEYRDVLKTKNIETMDASYLTGISNNKAKQKA
nr:hypothetical protein [Maliibacterium massiliense]